MIASFTAYDPAAGAALATFAETPPETIAEAVRAAAAVARSSALDDGRLRAELLRRLAQRLRDGGEALHELALRETGLTRARLELELERTCVQLELFAADVEEGRFADAVIDPADPSAPIAPRPDLRRCNVPLGPVAVFAASNFPYAFGVAGGDLASALAAGCPVVVKGHPSHPGTSEAIAREVDGAIADAGAPPATFALVQGARPQVGEALVTSPELAAAAFTGSLAGGRALMDLAAARPRPIPVFAEMGSVNPVVVSDGALEARAEAVAQALVAAVSGSAGQLCTKPGIVFVPVGRRGDELVADVAARLDAVPPAPLLNERVQTSLVAGIDRLVELDGVVEATIAAPVATEGFAARPRAFALPVSVLLAEASAREELFGPAALFVRWEQQEEIAAALGALGGQLTATLHVEPAELDAFADLCAVMRQHAGRVIVNGVPTGVAVTAAQQHGGPYPAASDARTTSVGSAAALRFLRPVAFQDVPAALLPPALRDENPLGIWRRVDGRLTREGSARG